MGFGLVAVGEEVDVVDVMVVFVDVGVGVGSGITGIGIS